MFWWRASIVLITQAHTITFVAQIVPRWQQGARAACEAVGTFA